MLQLLINNINLKRIRFTLKNLLEYSPPAGPSAADGATALVLPPDAVNFAPPAAGVVAAVDKIN